MQPLLNVSKKAEKKTGSLKRRESSKKHTKTS